MATYWVKCPAVAKKNINPQFWTRLLNRSHSIAKLRTKNVFFTISFVIFAVFKIFLSTKNRLKAMRKFRLGKVSNVKKSNFVQLETLFSAFFYWENCYVFNFLTITSRWCSQSWVHGCVNLTKHGLHVPCRVCFGNKKLLC